MSALLEHAASTCAEAGPHPIPLTAKQSAYLDLIQQMHAVTGWGCRVAFLAERFGVRYNTAREVVDALARKGWLENGVTPVRPRRGWLTE